MASISTRKPCAYDDRCKQMAAVVCEGCSKALCTKHFLDHRRVLGEEFDVVISQHDELQNTLNQQTKTPPSSHPLITQIDEWEQQSIVKIQQKAKHLRQELLQLVTIHLDELSNKIRQLSGKLKEGREEDSFVETDLQHWKKSLDDLNQNLTSPSTFSIIQHDGNALVQDISLNVIEKNDVFERVSDNRVQLEENGQVAIHDTSTTCIEIRGKKDYASGHHEILLRVEQSSNWIFLGINSKSTLLQHESYNSKSACGWSNNNYLWTNGTDRLNTSTSAIEFRTNDIISLIFDCDTRQISMINQRTNGKHEMDVNIENCPFPWQLHVILHGSNSRVRILASSS